MIYFLLLIGISQGICNAQYITGIDQCIRTAVVINAGAAITNNNVSSRSCGFIMQSDSFIVLKPVFVNIDLNAEIRIYLLSGNTSSPSKTLLERYYGTFLFKNRIFTNQGNSRLAFVVLTKSSYVNLGRFIFLFRTNCYVEIAAEDYGLFNSPNFYPDIPGLSDLLNTNNRLIIYCTYLVYSKERKPFAVRFHYTNPQFYTMYLNNRRMSQEVFSFPGPSNATFTFSSQTNYLSSSFGFRASIEMGFPISFQQVGSDRMSGTPQMQATERTYVFQYGSLSDIDAQVLCTSLGFGGMRTNSTYTASYQNSLLFHPFRCTGSEKYISQCSPVTNINSFYRNYYSRDLRATVIHCSENFPVRLVNRNNISSGLVQVKIGNRWGYICANYIDQSIGDVLCSELNMGTAVTISRVHHYRQHSETVIRNIRCGSHRKLKDCNYETSSLFINYVNKYLRNFEYYHINNTNPNSNRYGRYRHFSNCHEGIAKLTCRATHLFSLMPGHFQGFLRYNDSLVCNNSFAKRNADVYCRYLGYPGARKLVYNGPNDWNFFSRINLMCNGNEISPMNCPINRNAYCSINQIAGVICQTVALAGGRSSNEGRVDVFHNGRRGLLCDDGFNINVGNVICRQLGFVGATRYLTSAADIYGYGNRVYLLDDLNCRGNEKSIHQCSHLPWGQHNCNGNEVSGLVCEIRRSCGRASISETNAITNIGTRTTFGANPWQARLIPRVSNEWCSATILNQHWLVTSANCFTLPHNSFYITTIPSSYHWNSANWAFTHTIRSVFIHPSYSAVNGDHNIALVKVSTPIQYSTYVQPVCLPSNDSSSTYSNCMTTGWNHRVSSTNNPLMGKSVTIKNENYCRIHTHYDRLRLKRYLCSENHIDSWTVFTGESGGPLICRHNDQRTLVGIVTRPINGARATLTKLYIRVDYYMNWIRTTMARN